MTWGQMNRVGVGGSYVCCLAMIIIFIRFGRAGASPKREDNFYRGIDPSASLSELPTYFVSSGMKRVL